MKKKFAKIALIIIGLSISLSIESAYAFQMGPWPENSGSSAESAPKAATPTANQSTGGVNESTSGDSLSNATFNVGDTLKLDNGNQKLEYFSDKQYPPIISFILKTLNYATAIIGSLAMILLIIAGFRFMVAGGVQQKIDEAKDMIKFVLIGLVLTFLSYTITIFLQSVFIPQ